MSRTVKATCLINGYTLGDCFRPDPEWGAKTATARNVSVDCSDEDLIRDAKSIVPAGYFLSLVEERMPNGGRRTIFQHGETDTEGRKP